MSLKTTEVDSAEYLADPGSIAADLTDALEKEDACGVEDALARQARSALGRSEAESKDPLLIPSTVPEAQPTTAVGC